MCVSSPRAGAALCRPPPLSSWNERCAANSRRMNLHGMAVPSHSLPLAVPLGVAFSAEEQPPHPAPKGLSTKVAQELVARLLPELGLAGLDKFLIS